MIDLQNDKTKDHSTIIKLNMTYLSALLEIGDYIQKQE
jgi:hypothetical protein